MKIKEYLTQNKTSPLASWSNEPDTTLRAKVDARLARLKCLDNFGDNKYLKDGVYEFRFKIHSGLRIYFGKDGKKIIILLVGGNKSSQKKDIRKAKDYWADYKENN